MEKSQWVVFVSQQPIDKDELKIKQGDTVVLKRKDGLEFNVEVREVKESNVDYEGTIKGFNGVPAGIDPSVYPTDQIGRLVYFSKEHVWECHPGL